MQEPILFEISWEVCNKVGGIYRVLQSKAATMVDRWEGRYIAVGPYFETAAAGEFEPMEPGDVIGLTLARLAERGIIAHFGRWLVGGYPKTILFDLGAAFHQLDRLKYELWEHAGISAPPEDTETHNAIAFGYVVGEMLTEHARLHPDRRVIAHFHEWQASAALPRIRQRRIPVATVFTTHATLLGRYLCAAWSDFYERLPYIDADREAGDRNIYHRYCLERAAAHAADVFTTVSDVTAIEAEHLLKRRPECVLPNGLRVEKFAALHEFQILHRDAKEQIHSFVRGHFFGSHAFELDNTLYFFFAGRYEYRNKGLDLFIEALYRLNGHLQHINSPKTVVAFIIAPAPTISINVDVLNNQAMLRELQQLCDELTQDMGRRVFHIASMGRQPELKEVLTERDLVRLRRMIYTRRKNTLPPIVTHNMVNDADDEILRHLRHRALFNNKHDRVKVVFHPEFLTATSPLLGMEYEEFLRGCHLGVFPSYYEPWGYTPAECTVTGVPSVTSNLSGFGTFIVGEVPDHTRRGIYVIDRRHQGPGLALDELTQILIEFCDLNRRERIELRNRTERLSDLLDWGHLGQEYHKAHDLALQRAYDITLV